MDIAQFATEQEKYIEKLGADIEKTLEQAQTVVNAACSKVRDKAQDLRTQKDGDDPYQDKPSKTVSMAAQRLKMEEHKRLIKETEKDESRLASFCRLIDYLLVSETFSHILNTFSKFLDLFMDPPERLRSGIFRTSLMLGKESGSFRFNPTEKRISSRINDITEKLLSTCNKMPRISMSGSMFGMESAGKIAEGYHEFQAIKRKIRVKIADDFALAKKHAQTFDKYVESLYHYVDR